MAEVLESIDVSGNRPGVDRRGDEVLSDISVEGRRQGGNGILKTQFVLRFILKQDPIKTIQVIHLISEKSQINTSVEQEPFQLALVDLQPRLV